MDKDNFEFESEKPESSKSKMTPAENAALAHIPASVLKELLHPPFRKRHPFVFWVGAIISMIIVASAFGFALSKKDVFAQRERIALVTISGPIADPSPTLSWLRRVEGNAGVKGLLVRIDSPGGGAAASQEIYHALERFAAKMPVAVSMGSTAASGGLMVAMAGHRIFANPSTVTGSIGVRMDIPQIQDLMSKLGIGQETLVTAPFKDAASYRKPLTPQDRAYLQGVIMDMHRQFVEIVAKGHKMTYEKAEKLADGKIFTGQQAMDLGLIDAMGGFDDALLWLAKQTGIPANRKLVMKPQARGGIVENLLDLFLGNDEESARLFELIREKAALPAFYF